MVPVMMPPLIIQPGRDQDSAGPDNIIIFSLCRYRGSPTQAAPLMIPERPAVLHTARIDDATHAADAFLYRKRCIRPTHLGTHPSRAHRNERRFGIIE